MLDRVLFRGHLEDDEVVSVVVHKHWLLGVRALFWPALIVLASLVFFFLSHVRGVQLTLAIVAVISLVWLIRNFFDYFLDAWIITNHGIIDVAWYGWFHRESARVLYSDLQGVSYEIHGILSTLFNFGTISVEKISTGSAISMEYVKNPRSVEAIVLRNMETYIHKKNLKDSKQVQDMLSTLIAERLNMKDLSRD